ncbi:hypothetical protein HK097_010597 [Rhizophlyctis rosea]|uniref:Transmembrane protein n=1 Tax=Rhizophlyctis rosea TaxID=64517 RepID=A0AAD5SLL4_9FUNG|nr:hypothetical protein HK097_010597 [Rhizophlyctis rosea]
MGMYTTGRHLNNLYLRIVKYIFLAAALWSAGPAFWDACLDLGSGSVNLSASGAEAIGSLAYIIFQLAAILHRQYAFEEVSLTEAEWMDLQWVTVPRHHEEPEHWLLAPTSRGFQTLARLFFLMVGGGWIAFVTGFAQFDNWPARYMQRIGESTNISATVYDAFAINAAVAAFAWTIRLRCRWTSFGLAGCVAALICLAVGGSIIFDASQKERNSPAAATIAGTIFVLLGLQMLFVILLHRREVLIPDRGIRAVAIRTVSLVAGLGWILYAAGFAGNQGAVGGGLDPFIGYLLCTIPGLLAALGMMYEAFAPLFDNWSENVDISRQFARAKAVTSAQMEKRLQVLNRQKLMKVLRKRGKKGDRTATIDEVGEVAETGDNDGAAENDQQQEEMQNVPTAIDRVSTMSFPATSHPIRLPNVFFAALAIIVAGIPAIILSPHLQNEFAPSVTASPTPTLSRRQYMKSRVNQVSLNFGMPLAQFGALAEADYLLPTRTIPNGVHHRRQGIVIVPIGTTANAGSTSIATETASAEEISPVNTPFTLQFVGSIFMIFSCSAYLLALECCAVISDGPVDLEKEVQAGEDIEIPSPVEEEAGRSSSDESEEFADDETPANESSASIVERYEKALQSLSGGIGDQFPPTDPRIQPLQKTASEVSSISSSPTSPEDTPPKPRPRIKTAIPKADFDSGLTPNTEKRIVTAVRSLQSIPDVVKLHQKAQCTHDELSDSDASERSSIDNQEGNLNSEAAVEQLSPPSQSNTTTTTQPFAKIVQSIMRTKSGEADTGNQSHVRWDRDDESSIDENDNIGGSTRWLKKGNRAGDVNVSVEEL